jgi:pimeloyl-ACP methyl ester carboxylesterase
LGSYVLDLRTDTWVSANPLAQYHERLQAVAQCEIAAIDDAGHLLHHDQPQALATLMERFLSAEAQSRF